MLAALALAISSAPGLGQEVAGRLVSADGSPVSWALVRLVDPAGQDVATSVTTASGSFRLTAPAPGTYHVRAERIGFHAAVSKALDLGGSDPLALTLTASEAPIELETLEVRSPKSSCGLHPEEGSELLAIWTEVEKALELQSATEQSGLYAFHGEIYEYVVDIRGRPADEEEAEAGTRAIVVRGSSSFQAVDPELVVERGFRWEDGTFVGPDARTLLSEPFQATHCFKARRDDDRLGVDFEPAGSLDERIDVEGTLWLDAASGELQSLEYTYVPVNFKKRDTDGGYLEFEQLPDGAWIVRRWWIRVPTEYNRSYFVEFGGRINDVERLQTSESIAREQAAPSPGAGGGLAQVELARAQFDAGRPADGAATFRTACATGDSLTLEALWTDIRGLATSSELEEWETRPTSSRCALLGEMLVERALRAGLTVPQRLAIHYERLERARAEWGLRSKRVQAGAADSLGRHPDLMFDDRGFIFLRMGEPDEVAYAFAGPSNGLGNRVEGWRYDRPEGPRVFFFSPVTEMGVGVEDYRLLEAPWRAVGPQYGATQLQIVDEFPREWLRELYMSFQGLDPHYATLGYRVETSDVSLLQDLTADRQETLADIQFAADSVPDAPDLAASLRFAWERLRFFNPSSGSTVVWLVTAIRGGDLAGEVDSEGQVVYQLDLVAAVQMGNAVSRDSVRIVSRLPTALEDEDALVSRIPVSIGPGEYPFTLVVMDGNSESGRAGNWARGVATGLALSDLPEISDIAVAADSGGTWTRDGETFLASSPSHVTGPDGEIHLYFEVYGVSAASPYSVEIRVVPEESADRMWEIAAGETAFRVSFASEMPATGGIGSHHLRVDLSDTPSGGYTLGIRITETATGRQSLPTVTPVLRPD